MYKSHTLNYQEEAMKNLTTPKAILIGLGLIASAIAIQPVTGGLIGTANANQVQQVQICGWGWTDRDVERAKEYNPNRDVRNVWSCALVRYNKLLVTNKEE